MAIRGRAYINYPLVRPLNLTLHKAGAATITALAAATGSGTKSGQGSSTITALIEVTAGAQGAGGTTTIGHPTALTPFGPPYIPAVAAQSVVYIRNIVTSDLADLNAHGVETAMILADTSPIEADWQTAMWQGHTIRWLYPGTYSAGYYNYWVRIQNLPEIPVKNTGIIILL